MSPRVQPHKFILSMLVLLLLVTLTAVNVSPARADEAKPLPGFGKVTDAELTKMLLKKRAWYQDQYTIVVKSNQLAVVFNDLITNMKGKKREVSTLEDALAQFQQAILETEAARTDQLNIMNRNAGFNGFFNVLDRTLAGQTILDLHTSLRGTHEKFELSVQAFYKSFHDWKVWILETGKK